MDRCAPEPTGPQIAARADKRIGAHPGRVLRAGRPAALGALLASAFLLPLAGCGGLNPEYLIASQRSKNVREAAESYADDLRWGRLLEAAAQVEDSERSAFLALFKNGKQPFHFTSAEIVSVILGERREDAEVLVSYELYRPPSLSERTVQETQAWHYDKARQTWYLTPDLSAFTAKPDVSSGGR